SKYRLSLASSPSLAPDPSTLQVSQIALPSTVQDSLNANNPVDLYEFTLADRQRVNVALSGLTANADLRLLDSDRKELSTSTNAGIVEETIVKNLESGTYFLEVSGDSTSYRLISQASAQNRIDLYSGDGLLSQSGTVSPTQIPLPELQLRALSDSLSIPFESIPPELISPRDARESISPSGTTLNTELFDGQSSGLVGYISHTLDGAIEGLLSPSAISSNRLIYMAFRA
ncbi:MAG: hypothetical protein F6K35_23510, partial [Okeania sp. SIO2H7]|nr:hypothetical protein [Okeania sp. SIO2H7]